MMATAAGAERVALECVEPRIYRMAIRDIEGRNRLSDGLLRDMARVLQAAAQQEDLSVLLLEGLRDVFCAGASLDFLRRLSRGEADESSWWSLPEIFLSFPMPIIGSVTGHAVGGGLLVALYCDMVVAAEESRYGFNFIDLGFTPGMGATTLLPALVGTHFANEMLLTGKLYRGRELRERSVFNRVVPAAQVDGVVLDIARSLALKPAPVLALLKEALSLPRRRALPDTLQREALMHRICFASPDTARRIDELYAR